MKKRLSLIALLLVLSLTLVACGGSKTPATTPEGGEGEGTPTETTGETLKVGMVTDEGGVNDQSFNQSAWEGLELTKKDFGVDANYIESKQQADYAPNFETLLDSSNDMIWGVGYKLAEATYSAAQANPDTLYGIIDFSFENNPDYPEGTPENLVGVVFKDEQSSFLVGYIAGRMTESNKVGFVGGTAGDIILAFDHGYQAGVAYAGKELGKEIDVLSQYADSFSDSSKGKAIARNMYQQGRDVVFHAAGGVGDGVIEAAKEENKWVIGVDRDQNYLAPDNVLTSAMKRVDNAIYNVIKDLKDGKFNGGETIHYGLDNGAVDIAPTSEKNVPAEILEDVEKIKQEIIDGKIVVPHNAETFKDFKAGL